MKDEQKFLELLYRATSNSFNASSVYLEVSILILVPLIILLAVFLTSK